MEKNTVKSEMGLSQVEESQANPINWKNETVRNLAVNIMEEYFSIKEEPLPYMDPELLLNKIDTAMVYSTRIDDMPFLKQAAKQDLNYSACIKKIEMNSKPKYVPGTAVTRKRKISVQSYNEMRKRLNLILEERETIFQKNKRLLDLCKPATVVVKKIPIVISEKPSISFVNEENVQIKSEKAAENVLSNDMIELSDSDDAKSPSNLATLATTHCSGTVLPTVRTTTSKKGCKVNVKERYCVYFHDSYFNNTFVCQVDEEGEVRVYFQYEGINKINKEDILALCNFTSLHYFKRCCWYSFNVSLRNIWTKLFSMRSPNNRNNFDFLCRPHRCRPSTCECCCRYKYNSVSNTSLEILNCYNELIPVKARAVLKLRQIISSKIRKFLSESRISKELTTTTNTNGIIDAQTTFIHFKNIETCQSELYYFNNNGNAVGYYVNCYKYKMPSISSFIKFAIMDSHNAHNFIVCCWAKREETIATLFNTNLSYISPTLPRYMKRFHACDPQNCKCCCKNELKENIKEFKFTLKPLNLPNLRKHTVHNRPIQNVMSHLNLQPSKMFVKKKRTVHTKKVAVKNNELPKLLVADKNTTDLATTNKNKIKIVTPPLSIPHCSTPLHNNVPKKAIRTYTSSRKSLLNEALLKAKTPTPPVVIETKNVRPIASIGQDQAQSNQETITVQEAINIPRVLPISISETILTVDENRKVAAVLPSPVTAYSTEELQKLAKVLLKAQEQIDKFSLPPGTKLNINIQETMLNEQAPSILQLQNATKSTMQHQKIFKQFTDIAILKSQSYKTCFYHSNNTSTMKIKESESGIQSLFIMPVAQQIGFGKEVDINLAGPSGVSLVLPPISQGYSNVQYTEIVHNPDEDMAQLTPVIKNNTAAASSDPQFDDEYDIQYSDINEGLDEDDIKPVLHDDITIEENEMFKELRKTISGSENDEWILGS